MHKKHLKQNSIVVHSVTVCPPTKKIKNKSTVVKTGRYWVLELEKGLIAILRRKMYHLYVDVLTPTKKQQ